MRKLFYVGPKYPARKSQSFKSIGVKMGDYEKYIISLLVDNMTPKEILNSDSDEKYIYGIYFPLDLNFENFEKVTNEIIEKYKK